MKQIDRRIVIVAAFIFIVGLAYGIMRFLIAQKEEPPMRQAVEVKRYVQTERVVYEKIISPVAAPGRVQSIEAIDIVAEASGKIIVPGVSLRKGSRFNKGDVLLTIYPDEAALALKARKSQFLNSLANLLPDIAIDFESHKAQFDAFFATIDLDKPLPTFPEVKDEKLKTFLASRNILSEYYSILKEELQLQRHTIYAPFNGTYSDVYMQEGAYTNMGGRIAHAIRTDILEMEVPLERFDAEWVKTGDPVRLISDTRNLSWTGKVVRKSQFVDPNTQSQNVYVRVKKLKNNLLSGEYLRAVFEGHPIEDVMEVPRNIVFNTDEVFVVVDGRLQKRTINIIKVNERTLIFNGLEEDATLVMQPLINVTEGTLVVTEREDAEAQNMKKAKDKKE